MNKTKFQLKNKVTKQTFIDLGMWLTHPENHSKQQLQTLLNDDDRLPLITLSNNHWLTGALANSLKQSSVWPQLDSELVNYLQELELFYLTRSKSIQDEVIHACTLLQQANIKVILLKGGANLFNGVAKPISTRFMTDIDLLIPEDKQQQANDVLKAAGYTVDADEHSLLVKEHHHSPALFREDGACCVELHRWALKKSVSDVLSTEEVWQQAIPLTLNDDLSVLQLEPSQQLIMSVAHSELSHNGFDEKNIDLRQLLNVEQISNNYQSSINWLVVTEHFNRCNKKYALTALLYFTEQLFKRNININQTERIAAKQHFQSCLNIYEKTQNYKNAFYYISRILKGYNKQTIQLVYGEKGNFAITNGRLKHLKRHLIMAAKPEYIKHFINKLKSKL